MTCHALVIVDLNTEQIVSVLSKTSLSAYGKQRHLKKHIVLLPVGRTKRLGRRPAGSV